MDPDPVRLLETARPLRPPTLSTDPPNPWFRVREDHRLSPLKNCEINLLKKLDGLTQKTRTRTRFSRLERSFRMGHQSTKIVRIIRPFRMSRSLHRVRVQ